MIPPLVGDRQGPRPRISTRQNGRRSAANSQPNGPCRTTYPQARIRHRPTAGASILTCRYSTRFPDQGMATDPALAESAKSSRLQRATAWHRTGLPTLHGPIVGQWASAPSCLRLTDGCADKKVDQSNRSGWDRQVAGPPCQMPEPSWASSFLDRSAAEGPPIPGARLYCLADRGNLVQKRPRA